MPAGQPTKFNKKIQGQIKVVALKGFTDAEIAAAIGVTETTINNWKIAHSKFFESLKEYKIKADKEVERSLYERACGYSHPEDKIFNDQGTPLIVPTVKHYAPDTTAGIFWLKNRQPGKWRDKQDLNITGDMDIKVAKYADSK